MKVKMILPALTEAKSPYWRPIKYSLFPPLGLATLAGYLDEHDEVVLQERSGLFLKVFPDEAGGRESDQPSEGERSSFHGRNSAAAPAAFCPPSSARSPVDRGLKKVS